MKTVIDWKNCDVKIFKDSLALFTWHVCSVFDDVDDNCWLAEPLYKDLSRDSLKSRKAKVHAKSLPWMNSNIRKMIHQKIQIVI